MADKKYRFSAVSFNEKQTELIDAAVKQLAADLGFELSKSDSICLLLARYVTKETPWHPQT